VEGHTSSVNKCLNYSHWKKDKGENYLVSPYSMFCSLEFFSFSHFPFIDSLDYHEMSIVKSTDNDSSDGSSKRWRRRGKVR